jgi:hypothetical protein
MNPPERSGEPLVGRQEVADRTRALDKALADAARAAEEALVEGEPIGLWLLPLDDHLAPRGTLKLPADQIPPTPAERRWLMECLVSGPLAGAAGYIVVGEGVSPARNNGDPANRAEVIFMQAETRAGDARVRMYPIIWSDVAAPRLAPPQEQAAELAGTFSRLLQVADAFQGCVDDTLLQCALAAHADVIETLDDGDILMFAVGEQLVQVIGAEHRVRPCTKLRLRDIKAAAEAGKPGAQREYYELTAGRGLLMHRDKTNGTTTIMFVADGVRSSTPPVRRSKGH